MGFRMNSIDTALSGLQAAQTRLDVAANNVANAQTDGYRREQVVAQAQPQGGVAVQVERVPQPGADLVTDAVDQMAATYSWKANLQTLKTADAMVGDLLSIRA